MKCEIPKCKTESTLVGAEMELCDEHFKGMIYIIDKYNKSLIEVIARVKELYGIKHDYDA